MDRRCGSGLQAVLYAAGQVATGAARVVAAGGAESMSNVEHYALGLRTGVRQGGVNLMDRLDRARETAGGTGHPSPGGMIETAENLRREYNISRAEQDELSVRSHHRAIAAHDAGRFTEELVPVTVPGKRGKPDTVVDCELDCADLALDEIDLIELNEAFAAQVLAVLQRWKVDPLDERVNPNGSGISLGHPIGATGARILATAAYEVARRDARYVLETMCIGGGQGLAAVFEAVR